MYFVEITAVWSSPDQYYSQRIWKEEKNRKKIKAL